MKKFEYFEHTADILFKAYGKDVNEVFENAALAMFQVMVEEKINEQFKNEEISALRERLDKYEQLLKIVLDNGKETLMNVKENIAKKQS